MEDIEPHARPVSTLFRSIYAPHPEQYHFTRPFSFCYANPLAPPAVFGLLQVSNDMPPFTKGSVRDRTAMLPRPLPNSPMSPYGKRPDYQPTKSVPTADANSRFESPSGLSSPRSSPRIKVKSRGALAASDVGKDRRDGWDSKHLKVQDGAKTPSYKASEVPCMQLYDHMALENDRLTHELLRKLLPRGSPTFHEYEDNPPRRVLDLGCGQGHWVVDAACAWKAFGTKVTGLDLVDLTTDAWDLEKQVADCIKWVRHDFVQNRLPFPDRSFDLVRVANLHLAIPLERWPSVLQEIKRVLSDGGHLELIDDHMFFPYVTPSKPIAPKPSAKAAPLRSLFDSDDDDDHMPTSKGYKAMRLRPSPPDATEEAYREWEREMKNSREIEVIFEKMLIQRFKIHPRPSEFLQKMLGATFGQDHVPRRTSVSVCLPSREFMEANAVDPHRRKAEADGRSSWLTTIDWEKKERMDGGDGSLSSGTVKVTGLPPTMSKKAAARLGVSSISPTGLPYQQEGFVAYPSTFLPMSASDLEMHACRHLHMLLGYRSAMHEFVRTHKTDDGKCIVSPEDLDDALWDYQSFRRKRLNWPSDLPELRILDQFPESPRTSHDHSRSEQKRTSSSSQIVINNPKGSSEGLTPVRCFRVFEAHKPLRRF